MLQMSKDADRIGDEATKGPFFHNPLPQLLHVLLTNTLHADPKKRWTASNAVECLSSDVACKFKE